MEKGKKYNCKKIFYKCDHCGKNIEIYHYKIDEKNAGKRKSITCSKDCARKIRREQTKKYCEYCKKEFIPDRNTVKYCSAECRYKSLHKKTYKKYICSFCGKEFESKDKRPNRVKYCSKDCMYKDKNYNTFFYCDFCGKKFKTIYSKILQKKNGKRHSITCSKECANKIMNSKIRKTCLNCGSEYDCLDARKETSSFCCKNCYSEYRLKQSRHENVCEVCNKTFITDKLEQRFCSITCRAGDKHINNSIICTCVQCGKEFSKTISRMKKSENDFCSKTCHTMYGRSKHVCLYCGKVFEHLKYKKRKFCSKSCSVKYAVEIRKFHLKGKSRCNTIPQQKINKMLDIMDIAYINEHIINWYAVDNYLVDCNLIIEVMGDYWHQSPLRFPLGSQIPERVFRNIANDKSKRSYMKNNQNISILYIWETDINRNPQLCKLLINTYINQKGVLDNYQSFNYELIDGNIQLKKNIIIPYQDMDIEIYRQYLKKVS